MICVSPVVLLIFQVQEGDLGKEEGETTTEWKSVWNVEKEAVECVRDMQELYYTLL